MIIYVLGTDGSGKTTNALRYVREHKSKYTITYAYFHYTPILLFPLKKFAKMFLIGGINEFQEYDRYLNEKKKHTRKHKTLARLYSLIWYVDYVVQTWIRLLPIKLKQVDIVVVDRYYLDSVVNLGCLLDFNKDELIRDARALEKFLPRADWHVFLDVDEFVAFSRKNDIQSMKYLSERRRLYHDLKEVYNFKVVNAGLSLEEVFRSFKEEVDKLIGDGLPCQPTAE